MKNLYTFLLCFMTSIAFSQIDKAEYFIDSDPGTEMGIDIPIVSGYNQSKSFSINTAGLSLGIHTLYVRTRDLNRSWSLYYKHTFLVHDFTNSITPSQIIAAEYFIDTDPGTDSGTAFAITPGFSVSESLAISTAALSDGIHTLYIRTRDEDKRWSLYYKQTFLVHKFTPTVQTQIIKAEYFFDTDPGNGLGTDITITSGFNLNEAITLPSTGLTQGIHKLYIRVRDEDRVWSLYEVIEFEITTPLGVEGNLFLLTKIYPVPAQDKITVDTKNIDLESIKLFNLNGKQINNFNLNNSHINNIDVSKYAKGIYILRIKGDKEILNKKIVIK